VIAASGWRSEGILVTTPAPTLVAQRALEYVRDGDVVGLGTGRAATAFVQALGGRCRDGLRVRGIPTSTVTADLATQLGIPLVALDEVAHIDVTVDGADEVDPQLNLIKGYGGALVREKVVAAASSRMIVLVGTEKLVPVLGARGKLPVEVVPFAAAFCRRRLADLGYSATLRTDRGKPFVSDNGNSILDCQVPAIADPESLERAIVAIPGVVGTGLFLGMAEIILIDDGQTVQVRQRSTR
jgi:ribose 5-phosphate isomerase A